jgi:hypothetical protein
MQTPIKVLVEAFFLNGAYRFMGFGIANQNNFNFLASVYRQPLRSSLLRLE